MSVSVTQVKTLSKSPCSTRWLSVEGQQRYVLSLPLLQQVLHTRELRIPFIVAVGWRTVTRRIELIDFWASSNDEGWQQSVEQIQQKQTSHQRLHLAVLLPSSVRCSHSDRGYSEWCRSSRCRFLFQAFIHIHWPLLGSRSKSIFRKVLHDPEHVLHHLLRPVSAYSHSYSRMPRAPPIQNSPIVCLIW